MKVIQRPEQSNIKSVLVMEQELQLEATNVIKTDLATSPYIRFYLQEESLPPNILIKESYELPFNQIASEVVAELSLSSKLIAFNSRLTANLLDNGRDIYQKKKKEYFMQFLKEYKLIGEALRYLPQSVKAIFEYSVMAISNLILKLSISMSKISIILVAKLYTPPCLNLFLTALLFQKFLEVQLLRNRENCRSKEEYPHLVKQFPKISFIKISKIRNNFDSMFITQSQKLFSQQANNVQLLELYQQQNQKNDNVGKEKVDSYNLKKLFGILCPYGMELYLFISEILIVKMAQFKPDVIIFMEDTIEDRVGIKPQVKGLILNQLSTKVQNKIYIFKEFGLTDFVNENINFSNDSTQATVNEAHRKNLVSTLECQTLVLSQSKNGSTILNDIFGEFSGQNKVQQDVFGKVRELRKRQFKNKKNDILRVSNLVKEKKVEVSNLQKTIKKMRQQLLEQLSYLSLALIQKSNFQELVQSFHNYLFPTQFLNKFLQWLISKKRKAEVSKSFSQLSQIYKIKISKIRGMLEMSQHMTRERAKQSNLEYKVLKQFNFFNFWTKQIEIITQLRQGKVQNLLISQQDSFYVHYTSKNIYIFLFTSSSFRLLTRTHFQHHFYCPREELYQQRQFLSAKHSTLVANNKYFYKAFGEFEQTNDKSVICRLNIENMNGLATGQWQRYYYCLQGKVQLELQNKKWGWGQSIQCGTDNLIVLGGGYNFAAENEEKVNKFLYLIKNNSNQIFKVGKTNNIIINEVENMKLKNIIFPFVYGVPLQSRKGELVVLNTNGYLQNINHNKRLFLTKFAVPTSLEGSLNNTGVIGQNKMQHKQQNMQESIANKNTILSYIIRGYGKINRHNGECCYYDVQGRPVVVKIQDGLQKEGIQSISVDVINSNTMKQQDNKHFQIFFAKKRLLLNSPSTISKK